MAFDIIIEGSFIVVNDTVTTEYISYPRSDTRFTVASSVYRFYINSPVSTLCIGQASSMGSFLLAAGEKNKRFSLPNSRIMVHQPSGGFQGQATDIQIHAKEILDLKSRLNTIYSKHTGQTVKKITEILERDKFLNPSEAKELGLIDEIVEKR